MPEDTPNKPSTSDPPPGSGSGLTGTDEPETTDTKAYSEPTAAASDPPPGGGSGLTDTDTTEAISESSSVSDPPPGSGSG